MHPVSSHLNVCMCCTQAQLLELGTKSAVERAQVLSTELTVTVAGPGVHFLDGGMLSDL